MSHYRHHACRQKFPQECYGYHVSSIFFLELRRVDLSSFRAALDALEDVGFIRAVIDELHFALVDDEESLYGTPSGVSPPGSFPL